MNYSIDVENIKQKKLFSIVKKQYTEVHINGIALSVRGRWQDSFFDVLCKSHDLTKTILLHRDHFTEDITISIDSSILCHLYSVSIGRVYGSNFSSILEIVNLFLHQYSQYGDLLIKMIENYHMMDSILGMDKKDTFRKKLTQYLNEKPSQLTDNNDFINILFFKNMVITNVITNKYSIKMKDKPIVEAKSIKATVAKAKKENIIIEEVKQIVVNREKLEILLEKIEKPTIVEVLLEMYIKINHDNVWDYDSLVVYIFAQLGERLMKRDIPPKDKIIEMLDDAIKRHYHIKLKIKQIKQKPYKCVYPKVGRKLKNYIEE